MKKFIKFFAGALMITTLAVTGCKVQVESLTQEQMVSKLDEDSKNKVFDEILAGKNADNLLTKLSDEQKAAIFDKMLTDDKKGEIFDELLTDEKKNEIYSEKLTASEKAKIFDEILADKRTADTFLSLLTDAEKQSVYNEMLTSDEKTKIFNEIFADKRTNGKVVDLLNDTEKTAVFDALLTTKTSTDFIVEIITKQGNETVYQGVKKYITDNLTQAELTSLLNEDTRTSIFDEILAGKNADELLAKLSDEQKAAVFDKMLTDEKKTEIYSEKLTANEKARIFDEILADKRTNGTFLALLTDEEKQAVYDEKLTSNEKAKIFNEIFADKRTNGKVVELLNDTEKTAVFDALLATKTSTDFIVEIITKEGNETVYQGVKKYITDNLTQAELKALLNEDTRTSIFDEILAGKNADELLAKLSDEQKAAVFDKMLTDEKKTEIYSEKLTANEKARIFDEILADKRTNGTFLALLTDEDKQAVYSEKLTASEKSKIFDEILADKRTAGTFLSLLTDAEKQAVYSEKLTASEKAKIFDEILADKRTADTFLSLLTDAEKQAVYNEKLTSDEKAKIFNEIFTDKRTNGKVVELLNDTEKTAVFDALLTAKTSTDFIVEIITKQGNETVYEGVKDYITDNLTQAELTALLDATDTTAPGDVTNLSAIPGVNSVRLNWTDGTDTDNDLYGYLVSWEEVTSSRSITVIEKDTMLVSKSSNTDNSNGVTVSDLTGGTRYSFTVQAVDLIGNKSTGVTIEAIAGEEPIPAGFVKITGTDVGTYYMAKTELTYARWYEVYQWATSDDRGENKYIFDELAREGMEGTDGAKPTEESNQPVTYVSWRAAIIWCNAASEMENLTPYYYVEGTTDFTDKTKVVRIAENAIASTGEGTAENAVRNTTSNGYRLPTDAEWEYAAKGGENFTYSGSNNIDDIAWYYENSNYTSHVVGTKQANNYGLKDMFGNVSEWCWDIDPNYPPLRVNRGGDFFSSAENCDIFYRNSNFPWERYFSFGFRVCRSAR